MNHGRGYKADDRRRTFENFTSPTSPIFSTLKVLKLHHLFKLKMLIFVFESIDKVSPICFHNIFDSVASVHQYGTQQAGKDNIFLKQKILISMVSGQYTTMVPNAGTTSLWI